MKRFLRINDLKEITPPGLDGHRYLLSFDIGEMSGGDFKPIDNRQVTVTSSGTLQAVWAQTDAQIAQSSATEATLRILAVASREPLDKLQPIELNTYTAPRTPPVAPQALKNINELRKGYPAHGDNTQKFLPAHDFFRIPYPLTDFESAWEAILGGYFRAVKALRQILVDERSRRNLASNSALNPDAQEPRAG